MSSHLVTVVGVDLSYSQHDIKDLDDKNATDELVIVAAVGSVALDPSDCRFAGVKGDDIVDQGLALGAELDRFGWIGCVVLRCRGLANFKLLSWLARHGCSLFAEYGNRMG